MRTSLFAALLLAAFGFGLVGCSTQPQTEEKKQSLDADARNTLDEMRREDPDFGRFLDRAFGYAIYPSVGKGGFIVGGSYGKGEVYEQGRMIGYSDITQATIGAQVGGQAFAEVICFENKAALDKFIAAEYQLAAEATAVALKSGAGAQARFQNGIAIFTYNKGGLMAAAAVGGQRFRYTPAR
jgi:lipid-binding SYLF domain-containing protein